MMMEGNAAVAVQTLLTIPEEVLYNYIFPRLKQDDLIRLRRVCKATKLVSDDYIRNNFTDREREINETDHALEDFLQRDLPSSRIYLNNTSGPRFFEDLNIPEFLRLHGSRITHLRVKHFSTCLSEPENYFFLALPNLQHLELEFTDATSRKLGYNFKRIKGRYIPRKLCYFPATFKNLKSLKLGEMEGSEQCDRNYSMDIIEFCENLEHVSHPLYKAEPVGTVYRDGCYGCVTEPLKKWLNSHPDENTPLKTYDLDNYVGDERDLFFIRLVELCDEQNIKLLNVDSMTFEMVIPVLEGDFEKFARPLVSVKNVHVVMFLVELPNLEKVVINSTYRCSYCLLTHHSIGEHLGLNMNPRPKWPKLKILDMTIDSTELKGSRSFQGAETEHLIEFFFATDKRPKLEDLRIRFDTDSALAAGRQNCFPCPRAKAILRTCPNLRKLTLTNWLSRNKALSMLWGGLPLLEEVTLDKCKLLGNVAFVGENKEDPTFFKLKNLQKLTLSGLDSMPKVTDLVFELVFRNLNLKEFHLSSVSPVKSVTTIGIRSLLTGPFNDFVDNFPFHGWSLENVSEEEFQTLKSEFRASFMI